MSNDKDKEKAAIEFEKIMKETEEKRKKIKSNIDAKKKITNLIDGNKCYFRINNSCRRYPNTHIVEGNCVCGEFKEQ
jgi:hypothetical protein